MLSLRLKKWELTMIKKVNPYRSIYKEVGISASIKPKKRKIKRLELPCNDERKALQKNYKKAKPEVLKFWEDKSKEKTEQSLDEKIYLDSLR